MTKNIFIIFVTIFALMVIVKTCLADSSSNALHYLVSEQDSSGKISGFGGESDWAAIAFAADGVDIQTVKNPTTSLKDFLLQNPPAASSSATEWERKILAISAIKDDPENFGGVDYLQNLKTYFDGSQIGDVSLLNDDIFGLLALIASGSVDSSTEQTELGVIISHQNSDGGFSWSTNPLFDTSDSNDTAAAIQALVESKNHNLTDPRIASVIDNSKTYLLSTQKTDGGFGYDSSSDSDGSSTAWALQALNVLGLANSPTADSAKTWLMANQESDGGFHYMSGSGSDTYTTSHALIALSGNGWIIASASAILVATPSALPAPSISPEPSPTTTTLPTPQRTTSITTEPTPSIAPVSQTQPTSAALPEASIESAPTPTPSPQVLGENSGPAKKPKSTNPVTKKQLIFSILSFVNLAGAGLIKKLKIR